MCANYRTQRGLLLSESNETPTRPACILSRRRKSRVWMHLCRAIVLERVSSVKRKQQDTYIRLMDFSM